MGFQNLDLYLVNMLHERFSAMQENLAFWINDHFDGMSDEDRTQIAEYISRKEFTKDLRNREGSKVYVHPSQPLLDAPFPQIAISLGEEKEADRFMGDVLGDAIAYPPVLQTHWDEPRGYLCQSTHKIHTAAATKAETYWLADMIVDFIIQSEEALNMQGAYEISLTIQDMVMESDKAPVTVFNRQITMSCKLLQSWTIRTPLSIYATGINTNKIADAISSLALGTAIIQNVPSPSSDLAIAGPNYISGAGTYPNVMATGGETYTATGGAAPYTFSAPISGQTTGNTFVINGSQPGGNGIGYVSVTDSRGHVAMLKVRMANGRWIAPINKIEINPSSSRDVIVNETTTVYETQFRYRRYDRFTPFVPGWLAVELLGTVVTSDHAAYNEFLVPNYGNNVAAGTAAFWLVKDSYSPPPLGWADPSRYQVSASIPSGCLGLSVANLPNNQGLYWVIEGNDYNQIVAQNIQVGELFWYGSIIAILQQMNAGFCRVYPAYPSFTRSSFYLNGGTGGTWSGWTIKLQVEEWVA